MDFIYGFPIVTCETIQQFIKQSHLSRWEKIEGPIPLPEYCERNLALSEYNRMERFCPKVEAVRYYNPDRKVFTGFRTILPRFSTVFTALPHPRNSKKFYVPIICEWKHGSERVSLAPPSGIVDVKDGSGLDGMGCCAMREFLEETGIELDKVVPLCGSEGIPTSARDGIQLWYPFLGFPKDPIKVAPTQLDEHEFLEVVLFPLHEWRQFVLSARTNELVSIAITLLAMERLGCNL